MAPCGSRFLEAWLSGSPALSAMTKYVAFLLLLLQHDNMWVTASRKWRTDRSALSRSSLSPSCFSFLATVYTTQWRSGTAQEHSQPRAQVPPSGSASSSTQRVSSPSGSSGRRLMAHLESFVHENARDALWQLFSPAAWLLSGPG